jgi:hypothetical protein
MPIKKKKRARRTHEIVEAILAYDKDMEVIALVKDLAALDIHIGAWSLGIEGALIEFYLFGVYTSDNFHEGYHLETESRIRDNFLRLADELREWSRENQWEYESFIECFGADNRRKFVRLVDKHLSE